MLRGRLLAESLRVWQDLCVSGLALTRVGRHDVSSSTTPGVETDENHEAVGAVSSQPTAWTFIDFEAPDDQAEAVAAALARMLVSEDGWWADFVVDDVHYVVFANRVFRYRIGDLDARNEAIAYGIRAGTPRLYERGPCVKSLAWKMSDL